MDKVLLGKSNTEGFTYLSDLRCVNMGVPQGSIIRPLLFILYLNDLESAVMVSEGISFTCYADDTNIVMTDHKINDLMAVGKCHLDAIKDWFVMNGFILNAKKSDFIIFRTMQSNV